MPISSELEVFESALEERLKQLRPYEEDLNAQIRKLQGTQLFLRYFLYLIDFSDSVRSSERILRAMDNLLDASFNYLKHDAAIGIFSTKLEALIKTWRVRGRYYLSSSLPDALMQRALYGVKAITILVCVSLAWILLMCSSFSESESSCQLINSTLNLRVPPEFLWSASFLDLQKGVISQQAQSDDRGRIMDGLESLQAAAADMSPPIQTMPLLSENWNCEEEQIKVRMVVHVDEFKHKLERVDEDLRILRNQVDGFFKNLVIVNNAFIQATS